ncbi:uncharacterized protein LOC111328076 [Stylophora pistillata]|uniref:uncharacterized protein LOC111328076 n=1 Tax=Stylophora pistillata TaxID=50429 RepID=UPI000C03FFEB|nr:uncharacterized protein LOC111328076 [Stylophora pistillata]
MVEQVIPKLDLVLEKLGAVEFKLGKKKTERTVNDIENGMNFVDEERKSFMMRIQELQTQLNQLKDEKLYMEVYQRRENLRFFEIQEVGAEEDTKKVLVNFLRTELGLEDVDGLEFQRVHRIGKRDPSDGKPRQIIVRFLRYPDREKVMFNARKLKGKDFGISPDLPKEI